MEVLASFWLTRFLTLNFTSVTSQEAFSLESGFILSVDLNECASDSETECLSLALESATVKISLDIIFLCNAEFVQRLENDVTKNRRWEVALDVTTVDRNLTCTFTNVNAGNCLFTTT